MGWAGVGVGVGVGVGGGGVILQMEWAGVFLIACH